jgi:aldehyde:ferredoxin oxidoreductase
MHKPEYETMGALGAMCLNDDLFSILKMTDMCNRSGLDTISAGTVIAFAMECYEKGIITKDDTGGIELTWGNGEAMIGILTKMIDREGIGDILADGVKVAAQRIAKGADQFAMEVGGQEPGMHSPLFMPGRGTGYVCDPTPGRHTTSPVTRIESGLPLAPYEELQFRDIARYQYKNKGVPTATASCYWQVATCAGLCQFPTVMFGDFPTLDYLNAVTGWDMTMNEALETGRRIQTLRQMFNIREGVKPSGIRLHDRMRGVPAMAEGPLAGVTIDIDSLSRDFREAMGWDRDTAFPTKDTLQELGVLTLAEGHGAPS